MLAGRFRVRRVVRRTLLVLVTLVPIATIAFIPFAGRFLVREDPMQASDAIFVLAGARAERWLEGLDLYREGLAPRLVLSPGLEETAESLVRQRGIRYPPEADLARDAILQMGVPPSAVSVLDGWVDNTAQEAAKLHALASTDGWHRVIVVTSKYHTRRAAFAFHREFAGSGIQILMRASRYDSSDPAHWWRKRADIRYVLFEYEKLVFYRLGLGE